MKAFAQRLSSKPKETQKDEQEPLKQVEQATVPDVKSVAPDVASPSKKRPLAEISS